MNTEIATVIVGMVTDENEKDYFVQKKGITYQLSKNEGEHRLGDHVEGFVYRNQKGQLKMTTKIPRIRQKHYAFGVVTKVRKDLGVFVNIGLPDKDIVVSCDDLPALTQLWPKEGDHLMISLTVDEKERVWGKLASENVIRFVTRRGTREEHNQNVEAIVVQPKLVGTYVLTTQYQLGFIHPSERYVEPRLGERVSARVIGVRPDGVLNLSLKPRAHEVIAPDAAMIMTFLEQSPLGALPFSDRSTPEEIQKQFAISKGQFKRALGKLLKEGKVYQKDGWIYLKEE